MPMDTLYAHVSRYLAIAKELMTSIERLLVEFSASLKQQCDQFTRQYTQLLDDIRLAEREHGK